MLVLSRKLNETIVIDGGIRVTVLAIHGSQIRLGIEAPDQVGIYREELTLSGHAIPRNSTLRTLAVASSLCAAPDR
jgi:carbon storage regulator